MPSRTTGGNDGSPPRADIGEIRLRAGRRSPEKPAPSASITSPLEAGDIDEALTFYGRIFEFKLRGKSEDVAFIDLGDQVLALQKGRRQRFDDGRHFGLVVDDKEAARQALADAGVEALPGPFLDVLDPWGNRVEIVGYDNIQFSKTRRAARHGTDAPVQELAGDEGAGRPGHGAGLKPRC